MSHRARKKILGISTRTIIRLGLIFVAVAGIAWLAAWLTERSLISPNKNRAMQSWLDENLNADVNLGGGMRIRLNLVRRSRIMLHAVEVEHPNPVFPGKFALVGALGAWCPPWAVARLWAGRLDLLLKDMQLFLEENESGEWNIDGLMQPLASGENEFPLPMPKISNWLATFDNSKLSVRRNGYELELGLEAETSGHSSGESATLHARKMPFSFHRIDGKGKKTGIIGPGRVTAQFRKEDRKNWFLAPGLCEMRAEGLPTEIIPFLIPGIPLENVQGSFSGTIAVSESADSAGRLQIEGELHDAPLTVFGLPRNAPFNLSWPITPAKNGTNATMRMGPSGFGAFSLTIPLDESGNPKQLSMRGDVAALDDLPALLASHSRWPDWLSRSFPSIEWRASKWLGFGWSGDDMRLNLARSTAGLNLTGEAGLMGGRIRVALTPGKQDSPIMVAAEKVDAQLLGVKLSQLLPPSFKAQISGTNANFTWQGKRADNGKMIDWYSGMVFAKPVVDLRGSGEWWQSVRSIGPAVEAALMEWGGGDASEIVALTQRDEISMEQLSLVMEKDATGLISVKFKAFDNTSGQATGWVEGHPDGYIEGEIYLAGDSELLRLIRKANPDLGLALSILADESLGLRIVFRLPAGEAPSFHFPFLEEAKLIHDMLEQGDVGGESAP